VRVGEQIQVGRFTFTYHGVRFTDDRTRRRRAEVAVAKNGEPVETMFREAFYKRHSSRPPGGAPQHVARGSLRRARSYDESTQLPLDVFVSPLVAALDRSIVMAIGTVVAVWPSAAEQRALAAALAVEERGWSRRSDEERQPVRDRGGAHLSMRLRPHVHSCNHVQCPPPSPQGGDRRPAREGKGKAEVLQFFAVK